MAPGCRITLNDKVRGTEIGCESSVERKQNAKLGGSHDGIITNTSTRNLTTKATSAAATSQRTLSDTELHFIWQIKRAPTTEAT
jgi:hypothetical protein